MHKFVLWVFESLKNIEKFLILLCVFFIMMLALYWTMNLMEATWQWMGFISPILDKILDFVNGFWSFSFDFWGKTTEIKYFNAFILMLLVIGILKGLDILLDMIMELYEKAHFCCKKVNEKNFNRNLEKNIEKNEKQKLQYMLFIKLQIHGKYAYKLHPADLNRQNDEMNKFLSEKFNVLGTKIWDGFLYYLNDFEKVDTVLDIVYDQIRSIAPLEHLVCIQIGREQDKIKDLINLQEWNKIIISAETLNRYKYNNRKKYKTTNVGIFNKENRVLEVHEIREDL